MLGSTSLRVGSARQVRVPAPPKSAASPPQGGDDGLGSGDGAREQRLELAYDCVQIALDAPGVDVNDA
jgi:hypothetical protein